MDRPQQATDLRVTIVAGRNLAAKTDGKSDPYVEVFILNAKGYEGILVSGTATDPEDVIIFRCHFTPVPRASSSSSRVAFPVNVTSSVAHNGSWQ